VVERSPSQADVARHGAERARRAAAFASARRHSRFVRVARVALPLSGALAVFGFGTAARLAEALPVDVAVASTSLSTNGIVMEQPRVSGFDPERREYRIAAERATQKLTAPDEVSLVGIVAEIVTAERGTVKIAAGDGDYDNKGKTLRLGGGVRVASEDGYGMELADVSVDFERATMRSDRPVRIIYHGGDTVGDRIEAEDGGKLVVIEGRVKTVIVPAEMERNRIAAAPRPPVPPAAATRDLQE